MAKGRQKKSKPIQLRHGRTSADLGRLMAEEDKDLEKYYVRKDRYVDRAKNVSDQASFFVGPKGAGKSAILQMLRLDLHAEANRIINLSTKQLALSAFANIGLPSSLLIEANKKQWLYKSVWDYILATEVASREYIDEASMWGFLKQWTRGKDEKLARQLLSLRFDDDGNMETISRRFLKIIDEIEFKGQIGITSPYGELGKIEGRTKLDMEAMAKKDQFGLLGLVHTVSSRLADTIQNRYYILIDDLDVDWHNEPVQNEILAAMFASLRKICRPPHLKCVVSIQDRIFRELPVEHKDKFRDALCNVEWEAEVVREMIEKRVKYVVDTPPGKIWERLFPPKSFEVIWARISGKPREAIRLASLCIETARRNGRSSISDSDVQHAIKTFSTERLEDIGSELGYMYPGFTIFLRCFSGYPKEFPISKVKDAVDACILKSLDQRSPSYEWIRGYEQSYLDLARVLLENQILLFKRGRTDPPEVYNDAEHDLFSGAAYAAFHPMYAAGLGVIGAF